MAKRLNETELKALLASEIQQSVLYTDTELSGDRTQALEYYEGKMTDTPAAPGRSKLMSRDVSDTIGWMLPGIIRVFTASDRMAEYEPVGKGDDKFAKQATDYCNHIFWKDNPGYRILWDATHDSLLQKNGIIKHWWDDSEDCEYSEHSGLTIEQVALLTQDGGEVVSQEPGEDQTIQQMDPTTGQMAQVPVETFNIKLKRVNRKGMVRIECIEPDNFLLDQDAICIEDARFVAHRDEKTRSELIEMGFKKSVVDELPAYSQRDNDGDGDDDQEGYNGHDSTAPIELYECYLRVDVDGDGIAETIRAYYAGQGGTGKMLDWEVWDDDVPFSDIPCEPVPHRWAARSVADETMDMQRVNTVLTRSLADNIYWVNNQLMYAEEGSVTNPEMLKSPVFGGTIMLKKGTVTPPAPLPIPFIGDKILMGLEHFSQVIEKRTGVSRSTMALDPETLQNQSATANQNQKDASYSQVELIARNMAELGWKRVFKMILRLVVKHQDRPRIIRLKDEPVEMDPRFWNSSMDVTINVGLGTGSRDRDMAMLNNILQTQLTMTIQLAQAGFKQQAIEMIPKIIKTAVKIAESAGIRNPDEYYPDINEQQLMQMIQQASQPQPDPAMELEKVKAQTQKEIEAFKTQATMQLEQARLQQDVQKEQAQMQREVQKEQAQMEADLQVKMAEMQKEQIAEAQRIDFEREKLAEEARQKDLDRQHQLIIEQMKIAAHERAQAEANAIKREDGERNAAVKMATAKKPEQAKT